MCVLEEEVIITKQRTQFAVLSLTVCVSAEGREGSADACADTNTHTHLHTKAQLLHRQTHTPYLLMRNVDSVSEKYATPDRLTAPLSANTQTHTHTDTDTSISLKVAIKKTRRGHVNSTKHSHLKR